MTKDEALKLALDYIVATNKSSEFWLIPASNLNKTVIAIKEALAQPEQPKVRTGNCLRVGVCASEGHKIAPQRTWVGLTDKEIKDCFKITPDQHLPWHIYQRIEAELKEKNVPKN